MNDVVITIVAGMGMGAVSTALMLGVLIYTLFKRAGLLPGSAPEVRLRVQPDPKVAAAPYSTLDEDDEDDAEAADEAADEAEAPGPAAEAGLLQVQPRHVVQEIRDKVGRGEQRLDNDVHHGQQGKL